MSACGSSDPDCLLVTAAVIVSGGRVLLTRRACGNLGGHWEFPGGKVEAGETERECLEREIFEELGLHIRADRYLGESFHRYAWAAVRLRAWLCTCGSSSAEPVRLLAHDAFAWATPEELKDFAFAPADIPLLPLIAPLLNR